MRGGEGGSGARPPPPPPHHHRVFFQTSYRTLPQNPRTGIGGSRVVVAIGGVGHEVLCGVQRLSHRPPRVEEQRGLGGGRGE